MKIAIVHDYLNVYGGAEALVNAIWEIYKDADIYTANCDRKMLNKVGAFKGANIIYPKWKDNLHGKLGRFIHNILIANLPFYFEGLDLRDYDLVISSTAHFAKGIITKPEQIHVSYIHTPPRFLYKYPGTIRKRDSKLWNIILSPLDTVLRFIDYIFSKRPDYILCNSKEVEKRINKFYKRKVDKVINPFPQVTINEKVIKEIKDDGYFLIVSRLENYKNIDLAINVCGKNNIKLKIAGTGSQFEALKELSDKYNTVELLGFVSDKKKNELYKNSHGFLCTVKDEDFGMTAIESMMYGKPVIALKDGGYLETVISGMNGVFFNELNEDSLLKAIDKFNKIKFDSKKIRDYANGFNKNRFKKEFKLFIDSVLKNKST